MQIIVFLLPLVGFVCCQVPIPFRPDGYGVGGPADAHVVLEMFLDPLCPDSRAAWPTMQEIVQSYGPKIHFRIHTFPLPYHTNAFLASQGLHVIANVTNRNLSSIYAYTTKVFENQQLWENNSTTIMTTEQIIQSLASFVDQTGLTTRAKFLDAMANDDINFETRVSWKYACSRGLTGTPTFLLNGVQIDADPSWKFTDWKSIIDSILATN